MNEKEYAIAVIAKQCQLSLEEAALAAGKIPAADLERVAELGRQGLLTPIHSLLRDHGLEPKHWIHPGAGGRPSSDAVPETPVPVVESPAVEAPAVETPAPEPVPASPLSASRQPRKTRSHA